MRLRELLSESISLETTIRSVSSAIRRFKAEQVYRKLEDFATNYAAGRDDMKGFNWLVRGQTKRPFNAIFVDDLRPLLEKGLIPRLPPNVAAPLKSDLRYDRNLENLQDIDSSLPVILKRIGEAIKSQELVAAAQSWIDEKIHYENHLDELEAEFEDESSSLPVEPKTKAPKDPSIGQQRGQIEEIVNDVLNRLPENVRGEIRRAIARDDNKLVALKRELAKRGINL